MSARGLFVLVPALLLAALPASATFQVALNTGWNLISIPEQQLETDPAVVTASIADHLVAVWQWQDGVWRVYDPALPELSDLTIMDAGSAYWVEMSAADTLVGHGWPASSTVLLASGWNFVGLNDATSHEFDTLLASTGSCVETVWGFDGAAWHSWSRSLRQLSDLTTMEPGSGYWVEANGSCDLSIGLTVAPELVSLGDVELAALTAVTESELVFDGSPGGLAGLVAGDIVTGGPTALAETGFLRRVTGTAVAGAELHVATEAVALGEAFPDLRSGTTVAYDPSQVRLVEGEGVTLASPEKASASTKGMVSLEIDVVYEDVQPGVDVHLTGSFSFEPEFVVYLETSWGRTERFVASFTGRTESTLRATASVGADLEWSKTLGTTRFAPILVWAGPVPILIGPQLRLKVGLDGRAEVTLATEVGAAIEATAGVEYEDGSGWRTVRDFDYDFWWTPLDPGISARLKAWIGPQVEFQVYEVAGPYAAVRGFFEVGVSVEPPPLTLDVGADLKVGVTSSAFLAAVGVEAELDVLLELIRLRVFPEETATVTGTVVDEGDVPLGGVAVNGVSDDGVWTATTASDGTFSAETEADYFDIVRFSKTGYRDTTVWAVTVDAGQTLDVGAVRLYPEGAPCSIAGIITDASTAVPVEGVTVLARQGTGADTGGVMATSGTTTAGAYTLSDLDPGAYTVGLLAPGYMYGSFAASCASGEASTGNDQVVVPETGWTGDELTVYLPGGVPLTLVRIPAGTFMMGSPADEWGRYSDEYLHQVTLTQDYYLGKYKVTQRQWQAVMGSNPSHFSSCGLDCPVEQVSWNDICGGSTGSTCTSTSFVGRLNGHLGTTKFRLPTEAEWERAARGGTQTEFSFAAPAGWDLVCGSFPEALPYMWWCNNAGSTTHTVGQKQANPYGLYDVHGNVWEWVADWYGSYPSTAATNPTGPSSGSYRVLRGGGWLNTARRCRSAYRQSDYSSGTRYYEFGFRLARSQ